MLTHMPPPMLRVIYISYKIYDVEQFLRVIYLMQSTRRKVFWGKPAGRISWSRAHACPEAIKHTQNSHSFNRKSFPYRELFLVGNVESWSAMCSGWMLTHSPRAPEKRHRESAVRLAITFRLNSNSKMEFVGDWSCIPYSQHLRALVRRSFCYLRDIGGRKWGDT